MVTREHLEAYRPKILIVDDERENIDIVKRMLSGASFQFSNASGGREAFAAVLRDRPDVVVMDWQMPGMNGMEVLEKMKSDKDLASIPVIIMTGIMKDPEHMRRASDAGAAAFIRKPIDSAELNARVRSALASWKS